MTIKTKLIMASFAVLSLAGVQVLAGAGVAYASEVEPVVPVHKEQCKKGGWVNLVDDQGQPFKNQGQCVAFTVPERDDGVVVD